MKILGMDMSSNKRAEEVVHFLGSKPCGSVVVMSIVLGLWPAAVAQR